MITPRGKIESLSSFRERKRFDPGVARTLEYFDNMSHIRSQSRHEREMGRFLVDFAKKRGFEHDKDRAGNVIMIIPATENKKNAPRLILQAHQDMVCLGKPNPAENGVRPIIDPTGKRIVAKNTTLAGDNRGGISELLALVDEPIEHGELIYIFTTAEEVGLEGAEKLNFKKYDMDYLSNNYALINVDGEKVGKVDIGSAAAGNSIIELPVKKESTKGKTLLKIVIEGGKGGHSGVDIHKKRVNAIRELADILQMIKMRNKLNLVSFTAGEIKDGVSVTNAISSSAEAVIAVDKDTKSIIRSILKHQRKKIHAEYKREKKLKLSLKYKEERTNEMMDDRSTKNTLDLLSQLPHGVIERVKDNPLVGKLTTKSTNLAIVRTEGGKMTVQMMSRSAEDKALSEIRDNIKATAKKFSAKVKESKPYPSCSQPSDTDLFSFAKQLYEKKFGKPLKLSITHGGLELGWWKKFWPKMPMLAIPAATINDAHSKTESMLIGSITPAYRFLTALVEEIAR